MLVCWDFSQLLKLPVRHNIISNITVKCEENSSHFVILSTFIKEISSNDILMFWRLYNLKSKVVGYSSSVTQTWGNQMLPAYPKQNRLTLSPLGRNQVSINTHAKPPSQARLKKKNGPGDKAKSHTYSTTVLCQVSPDVTGVWIPRYIPVGFYYKDMDESHCANYSIFIIKNVLMYCIH